MYENLLEKQKDITSGSPHLIAAFLWQIIKVSVLKPIKDGASQLLEALGTDALHANSEEELNPEQAIVAWVNRQLEVSGTYENGEF
jgi:hypothetical protein